MFSLDKTKCCQFLGTKIDLRDDKETVGELARKGYSPIKREQAVKVAGKIKAYTYVECSALTQKGLKQVRLPNHNIHPV